MSGRGIHFDPPLYATLAPGPAVGGAYGLSSVVVAPATGTYLILVGSSDSRFDGTGMYQLRADVANAP